MSIPGGIGVKSVAKVIAVSISLLMLATAISIPPILRGFQDFFINGIQYDANMKLFVGLVDKEIHLQIFGEYYGRLRRIVLSWDSIDSMVANMFSHDVGQEDLPKLDSKSVSMAMMGFVSLSISSGEQMHSICLCGPFCQSTFFVFS